MRPTIKVAILDDHQNTIDGYRYKFEKTSDIEIVKEMSFGEELEEFIYKNKIDILLLDISVPISATNKNSFPVLHLIREILDRDSEMTILVISMHSNPTLIEAALAAGANGYVLKDDTAANQELTSIVRTLVNAQGFYLSKEARQKLMKHQSQLGDIKIPLRELQALSLCAAYPDTTTLLLARRLGVAHSTFRTLLSNVYVKLEVNSKSAAIIKAIQMGLTLPPTDTLPNIAE